MIGSRVLLKPVALVAGGLLAGGLAVGAGLSHEHASSAAPTTTAAAPSQSTSEQLLTQAVASTTGPDAAAGHGKAKGWLRGRLGRFDGRLLHGELVVRTKTGTETLLVQRGVVTAVGSSTVTVRSSDGFTQTWAVNSSTKFGKNPNKDSLAKLKDGDLIALVGKVGGPNPTAMALRARTPGAQPGKSTGSAESSSTDGARVSGESSGSATVSG